MSIRHFERLHAAAAGGINRRTFLGQVSCAAGATLLLPVIARSATLTADGPVAETSAGNILGVLAGGVHAFKGVPYGAPTSGRNRFMPPQKPNPWSGIRSATDWAGRAPQAAPSGGRRPELSGLSGAPDRLTESEDCLTVNIWTRGLKDGGKRPIMVWYHGGGFGYGSANTPRLDGGNLAALYDVVVVTVNQRLNILGHLHLADIGGEAFAQSGNAGTLDMVAALQWVKDNADRFGGDSGNVTVFGQSGGGGKVSTLLATPTSRGLFHRAIVMSGATIRLSTRERAGKLAEAVLKHLGLTRTQVGELQTMPFKQLIAAIGPARKMVGATPYPLFDRYDFGPVVDGKTLPTHPFDPSATDISADIPVLVGNVKDEMAIYLAPDDKVWDRVLSEDEMRARILPVAGAATDRVVELYRKLAPGTSPADRLISALTDSNFRIRSLALAERKAAQGRAPVWLYSFDWETPVFGGKLKAYHALDVPFVFNTIDVVGATDRGPVAHDLSRRMSATWAAFARSGKPDNPAIPHWPAYTLAGRSTMIFNRECSIASDYGGEARLLWKQIAAV